LGDKLEQSREVGDNPKSLRDQGLSHFFLHRTETRMFFWLRELAGWGLIGGSLVVLKMGLDLALDLQRTQIVQASIIVFGAMGLLRAGVLLIRMSTAARICRADQEPERART
jgi:hypothetical protein